MCYLTLFVNTSIILYESCQFVLLQKRARIFTQTHNILIKDILIYTLFANDALYRVLFMRPLRDSTQIQISREPILIALIFIISTEFWSTAADAEQPRAVAGNHCNSEQSVLGKWRFPSFLEFQIGRAHV